MTIRILFLGCALSLITLKMADSRVLSLSQKNSFAGSNRMKRQFPSQQGFQGFQFGSNRIFFDDDNVFNDVVQPSRPKFNQIQNSPRPQGSTTVAIPGMGTTQSACEDRCLTTPQYDPVCADNDVTYMNIARFKCATRCGKNIRIVAYRACPRANLDPCI